MIDGAGVAEHLDVLVVGAGLSGIAAAHHLQVECPGKTFAIIESRARIGGTWDLFRYPGVRSDSDIFTLGCSFKPWAGRETIAEGQAILDYIKDAARDSGIESSIRFGHRLASASWDSSSARWTVQVDRGESSPASAVACNFIFLCTGYFSYREGHRPEFPGEAQFRGAIVHPQFWPEGLDYRGKQVVVIGSGATAVTLASAMAADAARVTILQRSPGYLFERPRADRFVNVLRSILPGMPGYRLARLKFMVRDLFKYQAAMRLPTLVKRVVLLRASKALGSTSQVAATTDPLLKLDSNYIALALVYLPKQGNRLPWKALHNYARDIVLLRLGKPEVGSLLFSKQASKGP